MRRQGAGRSLLRALGLAGLLAVGGSRIAQAADEPALVEKMLSPDSVVAIVLRNPERHLPRAGRRRRSSRCCRRPRCRRCSRRSRRASRDSTARCHRASRRRSFSGLFPCESALAAVVLPQANGGSPELMIQLILHPADPVKGQATIKALFDWLGRIDNVLNEMHPAFPLEPARWFSNAGVPGQGLHPLLLHRRRDGADAERQGYSGLPEASRGHSRAPERRRRAFGGPGVRARPEPDRAGARGVDLLRSLPVGDEEPRLRPDGDAHAHHGRTRSRAGMHRSDDRSRIAASGLGCSST